MFKILELANVLKIPNFIENSAVNCSKLAVDKRNRESAFNFAQS